MAEVTHPKRDAPPAGPWRRLAEAAVLLAPFAAALLYGFWSFSSTDRHYASLERFGVETMATILDKRMVRHGTDRPRYHYEMTVGFTVGETMRRGSVQVSSSFYERHDPPQRVPIRYLPTDPQVRSIDPAMRGQSMRSAFTIVALLLVIGFANLGMARRTIRSRTSEKRTGR